MQVLPHQAEVLRAELADVERELGALKTQRSQIERRVAWRRWAGQSLGLGLILLPWAVLFRLTYWDLSWDVVVSIGMRVDEDDQGLSGSHMPTRSNSVVVETLRPFIYSTFLIGAHRILFDGPDDGPFVPVVHATSQGLYLGRDAPPHAQQVGGERVLRRGALGAR